MRMLKDAARALSLANLCFIVVWGELLSDATPWQVGFNIYARESYAAVLINIFLLAAFFWVAMTLARRSGKKFLLDLAHLSFPLVLLVTVNSFLGMMLPMRRTVIELIMVVLAIAIVVSFDFGRLRKAIVHTAAVIVLVLFPFFLLTTFQAVRSLANISDKPLAPSLVSVNAPARRVLWLVFDEMDQQVAFSRRPASVELPEFDRFRDQALHASNAYPPADSTGLSMPALITGKFITKAESVNPSKIMITFADSESPVSWGSQPNVFSRAREAGFNTAVIGWYIPYCRVIGEGLTQCSWQESEGVTLRDCMFGQLERLVDAVPLMPLLVSSIRRMPNARVVKRYTGILEAAKQAALDPGLGLIMVHWPVPHPPGIYNRQNDAFDLSGKSSYLDSLKLSDRTLGEVRRVMEDAGMWDDTIVLVTSDHWWKSEYWRSTTLWTKEDEEMYPPQADHRVPFLLKLSGQKEGVKYEGKFNTIVTHDVLLALLKGELTDAESVVDWLDGHRARGESVYHSNKH